MKHAELEGLAVAYALLIMKGWSAADINADILARFGPTALVRVKKRAWQHVKANEATP